MRKATDSEKKNINKLVSEYFKHKRCCVYFINFMFAFFSLCLGCLVCINLPVTTMICTFIVIILIVSVAFYFTLKMSEYKDYLNDNDYEVEDCIFCNVREYKNNITREIELICECKKGDKILNSECIILTETRKMFDKWYFEGKTGKFIKISKDVYFAMLSEEV